MHVAYTQLFAICVNVWHFISFTGGVLLRQGPCEARSNPQSRSNVESIYVPTITYPSLVPKPPEDSVPSGQRKNSIPMSEPDLTKQPTRSALKGAKKKDAINKELEVKLQERLSLTESGSPRTSGSGGPSFAFGPGGDQPTSGSNSVGGGGVKFGATEERFNTPTGMFVSGQVNEVNA